MDQLQPTKGVHHTHAPDTTTTTAHLDRLESNLRRANHILESVYKSLSLRLHTNAPLTDHERGNLGILVRNIKDEARAIDLPLTMTSGNPRGRRGSDDPSAGTRSLDEANAKIARMKAQGRRLQQENGRLREEMERMRSEGRGVVEENGRLKEQLAAVGREAAARRVFSENAPRRPADGNMDELWLGLKSIAARTGEREEAVSKMEREIASQRESLTAQQRQHDHDKINLTALEKNANDQGFWSSAEIQRQLVALSTAIYNMTKLDTTTAPVQWPGPARREHDFPSRGNVEDFCSAEFLALHYPRLKTRGRVAVAYVWKMLVDRIMGPRAVFWMAFSECRLTFDGLLQGEF